jgi:hypothetical protein
VPGLDTVRGLGLFDGQAELYLRCCAASPTPTAPACPRSFRAASTPPAGSPPRRPRCAARGGAIGATGLEYDATRLETLGAAAAGAEADALARALQAALVGLAGRLGEILGPGDEPPV